MSKQPEKQPEKQQRPRPNMKNLGRGLGYVGRYRTFAGIAVVALLISIVAQLMVPQLVQNILDAVAVGVAAQESAAAGGAQTVPAIPPEAIRAMLWAVALIIIFAVARGAFAFAQSFMAEKLSQSIAYDIRNELFAKIQRLSFSYHDRNRTGQLMIRATDDVEKLRVFVGQGLLMTVQSLVLLTGALTLLFITNWRLTLVVLPILPVALVLFMAFGTIVQPLFIQAQAKLAALNTVLQETLAGIRVVKAFAREPQQMVRFRAVADEVLHQQLAIARTLSFLFPSIFLIANLGQVAVLYFGGVRFWPRL